MLEKMKDFFESRLDGYDAHQMNCIESAPEFYAFTAGLLPKEASARVLDLGCGTGLELERYFSINPSARVTGIDLASGMLEALKKKLPDKDLTLITGSYFDEAFGNDCFDAAVSVESLHHFTREEKIPLYGRICRALKKNGFFVLTDYFSLSDQEEIRHRREFLRLKELQGIRGHELYHYDTPLTVQHEREALRTAGFSVIEMPGSWGSTHTLKAEK